MKTSGELALWYTDLIAQAETAPSAALAAWNAGFDESAAFPVLDQHRRGFARLAARLSGSTQQAQESADIEQKIEAARGRLAASLAGMRHDAGLGFTLIDESLRGDAGDAVMSERDPGDWGSPDIDELEQLASAWSGEEWCVWLNAGFRSVRADDPETYLAFAPLRLYPVGRYVEQVGDALSENSVRGAVLRGRVVEAVETYLRTGEPAKLTTEREFWVLLDALEFRDANAALARAYLKRKARMGVEPADEVIEAICALAWRCCANPTARASFFQTMAYSYGNRMRAWEAAALIEEAATSELEGARRDAVDLASGIIATRMSVAPSNDEQLQVLIEAGMFSQTGVLIGHDVADMSSLNAALRDMSRRRTRGAPTPLPATPRVLEEEDLMQLVVNL